MSKIDKQIGQTYRYRLTAVREELGEIGEEIKQTNNIQKKPQRHNHQFGDYQRKRGRGK